MDTRLPGPDAGRVRLATITSDPLSVDVTMAAVTGPAVGGIAIFVGVVRDVDGGRAVNTLDYTAHPGAGVMLREVASQIASTHDVIAVAVQHRTGHLEVGDLAVIVTVGAEHRGEALAACRQLIDDLKARVPIWKEQHFGSGETEWVGLP